MPPPVATSPFREVRLPAEEPRCLPHRILWWILLPLARPALATATIFAFLAHWNDFWSPLIFLNTADNYTIPLGLRWLQTTSSDFGRPKEHLLLAAALMATTPILVLYFTAQKYFVQGIVMSGIKG